MVLKPKMNLQNKHSWTCVVKHVAACMNERDRTDYNKNGYKWLMVKKKTASGNNQHDMEKYRIYRIPRNCGKQADQCCIKKKVLTVNELPGATLGCNICVGCYQHIQKFPLNSCSATSFIDKNITRMQLVLFTNVSKSANSQSDSGRVRLKTSCLPPGCLVIKKRVAQQLSVGPVGHVNYLISKNIQHNHQTTTDFSWFFTSMLLPFFFF